MNVNDVSYWESEFEIACRGTGYCNCSCRTEHDYPEGSAYFYVRVSMYSDYDSSSYRDAVRRAYEDVADRCPAGSSISF